MGMEKTVVLGFIFPENEIVLRNQCVIESLVFYSSNSGEQIIRRYRNVIITTGRAGVKEHGSVGEVNDDFIAAVIAGIVIGQKICDGCKIILIFAKIRKSRLRTASR